VKGDLAAKLLASLQCSAAQTVREVQCGWAIAQWVTIPLKSLSFAKTLQGVYDLGHPRVPAKFKPLLKFFNKLAQTKITIRLPGRTARTTVADALAGAKDIQEVVAILAVLSTTLSRDDVSQFALDLLEVGGLKSCVEALAAAVE